VTGELSRAAFGAAAEAIVVGLAIAGDDAAYGELVRRRHGQIRGLLRRLCGNAVLADDLAQQAFLQGWRRIRALNAPGAFGGWLRQIAVNAWLQHFRAHGNADDRTIGTADDPVQEAMVAERLDLDRALSQLAPDARICIVLAYGERMSHREIAEATDLPLGTVKSHITRGACRLRELLSAYETTS
jgi:RNA polymerase sigma-70 factor (ECF subfamily)